MARTSKSVKIRNKPPVVEVAWFDAHSTDSGENYTLEKALDEDAVCRYTCGYLLIKNSKKTIIASTWDHWEGQIEATYTELTIIPSKWVVTVKQLSPAKQVRLNNKTSVEE